MIHVEESTGSPQEVHTGLECAIIMYKLIVGRLAKGNRFTFVHSEFALGIFNPRRACAARVTAVVLCVCLCVCLFPLIWHSEL